MEVVKEKEGKGREPNEESKPENEGERERGGGALRKGGREEGRNCFVLASLTHSLSPSFYHFSLSLLFPSLTNVVPRQVNRTEHSNGSEGLEKRQTDSIWKWRRKGMR